MDLTNQPKKRGRKPKNPERTNEYFSSKQEEAVKMFLTGNISERERNYIFENIIDPSLKELIDGILKMPMFQKLVVIGTNVEQLKEDAYFHLVENMHKFDPNRIGKKDTPVKAFSYYGTIVKNYFLALKIKNDKLIAEHKGAVDIDDIKEQVPANNTSEEEFNETIKLVIDQLDKTLTSKKLNKNDLVVGHTLRYMLINWHKIEFQDKNEFIRKLCYYTQLKPTIVARSLKKYKTLVYDLLFQPRKKRKSK
jgi:hypothetical protein